MVAAMDAQELWDLDPEKFNEALSVLMDSAAAAASTASSSTAASTPTSPPADPRLRKRPALHQRPATKKTKIDGKLIDTSIDRPSAATAFIYAAPTQHVEPANPVQAHPLSRKAANVVRSTGASSVSSPDNVHPARAHLIDGLDSKPSGQSGQPKSSSSPLAQKVVRTGIRTRDAVHRQFDPSQDNVPYEELLARRRSEHLINVDRYVPSEHDRLTARRKSAPGVQVLSFKGKREPFPFGKLPKEVKEKILGRLLVGDEPVVIDFTWLRPFVNGHCRIPSATKTIELANGKHTMPVEWAQLTNDVKLMQHDCLPFTEALEVRGNKTRKLKGPCRGLTTGLLRVSKEVHKYAAPIFYGQNAFHFPWATSAWMQLETFLATIGSTNVQHIRSIGIHVPLWHRGILEDFVEGSILDLTSPASRLGVIQPVARDRLLSAIRSSVQSLVKAGKLNEISFHIEHGMTSDHWTGRYRNDRQLISAADAEEHVTRKQQGIVLLKQLSEIVGSPPTLSIHHPGSAKIAKYDLSEFRGRLASIIKEAEGYGWKVDQTLRGRGWSS